MWNGFVIERCIDCRETQARKCVMWEAVPVPWFGPVDGNKVMVATVGLNPSATEFVDERPEWHDASERLPVVMDWEAEAREKLDDAAVQEAGMKRVNYFAHRKDRMHPWFKQLEGVMRAVRCGWSYERGTAVHLDIVACPTWQQWGDLDEAHQQVLMQKCFPKFCATLKRLHAGVCLLLDGRTVSETVIKHCQPKEVRFEVLEGLEVWSGTLPDRFGRHRFLGWSNPVKWQKKQNTLVEWLRQQAGTSQGRTVKK